MDSDRWQCLIYMLVKIEELYEKTGFDVQNLSSLRSIYIGKVRKGDKAAIGEIFSS